MREDEPIENHSPDQQSVEEPRVSNEFLRYSTIDYIRAIYPNLNLEDLAPAIQKVQEQIRQSLPIDAGAIARENGLEDSILIENVAFLEFNRHVANYLLHKYPEDHKSALEIDGGGVVIGHAAPSLVANKIVRFEYLPQGETEAFRWLR